MNNKLTLFLLFIVSALGIVMLQSGCAQISAPTGGIRDSIAPVLVKASPPDRTTNFTGNRIVLTFDEYIDVQDINQNVMVSPLQKQNPVITYNFRTVTIRFRDTLLPSTTYSINFGNAIKDLNEGNPFKEFTYTFSTGSTIDSLSFNGKVLLAETGKTDSTLIVMLYRNTTDTAVLKSRPSYITRVDGEGNFSFLYLPADTYHVYALKDGDGGKTYNSKSEMFAFLDSPVVISNITNSVTLYAYTEVPDAAGPAKPVLKTAADKRLRVTTNLDNQQQSLLLPLELSFNNPIKTFLTSQVQLTDTNNIPVPNTFMTFDSTRKKLQVNTPWKPVTDYRMVLPKDAIEDSSGNTLVRADTIEFSTKRTEDYGTILLRFNNLEKERNPVLQFVQAGEIKGSYPITSLQWSSKLFAPGEYEIRILYDENKNGKWDPGNFRLKQQPEKAVTLTQKIQVRANWDNEQDINF